MTGILDISQYTPRGLMQLSQISSLLGTSGGKGSRSVANFDEDTTTMAVEAIRLLDSEVVIGASSLWMATTSPAYMLKSNATAVHAATQMRSEVPSFDVGVSLRAAFGSLRAAHDSRGIAVLSDTWSGLPGGDDERLGADAASAIVFGSDENSIAIIKHWKSSSVEVLERWKLPTEIDSQSWDDRFGAEALGAILTSILESENISDKSIIAFSSANPRSTLLAAGPVGGARVIPNMEHGFSGVADTVLKLTTALEIAQPGDNILLVLISDGIELVMMEVTERITNWQKLNEKRNTQRLAKREVQYADFLSWRGRLSKQVPRRPEPQAPASPPSFRNSDWKFGLVAAKCHDCGAVHAPPEHRCRGCGQVGNFEPLSLSRLRGTVVTFTIDKLAYTPAPPLVLVVVDFGNGARASFEVTDSDSSEISIGLKVELVFRRINTAAGVHNYFWKVRPIPNL